MDKSYTTTTTVSLKDGYILYSEIKNPTIKDLEDSFRVLSEVIRKTNIKNILLDISESEKPSAEIRYEIKRKWIALQESIDHVAIVTGKGVLINISAQFIARSIGLKSFSIHKAQSEAIERFRNAS